MSQATDWCYDVEPGANIGCRSHGRSFQTPSEAPTIRPDASGAMGAQRLAQHVNASLMMSSKAGTEDHSIADNMPAESGPQGAELANQLPKATQG